MNKKGVLKVQKQLILWNRNLCGRPQRYGAIWLFVWLAEHSRRNTFSFSVSFSSTDDIKAGVNEAVFTVTLALWQSNLRFQCKVKKCSGAECFCLFEELPFWDLLQCKYLKISELSELTSIQLRMEISSFHSRGSYVCSRRDAASRPSLLTRKRPSGCLRFKVLLKKHLLTPKYII